MEGYGITSDEQLRKIAKQLGFKLNYVGFAEDLPNKLPTGINIINLGDESIGGSHWTLMFLDKKNVYYFDSYGTPPEDSIVRLAEEAGYQLYWTTKQVQGYNEEYCGIWALMMAKTLYNAKDKKRAMDMFLDQYNSV
jgi:hypothetical protein